MKKIEENKEPRSAESYFSQGEAVAKENQFEMAIKYYDEAINLNPNVAKYYYYKGICHHILKQYNESAVMFNKVIEMDPNNADAYGNKGDALYFIGEYDESSRCYNKAAELNPARYKAKPALDWQKCTILAVQKIEYDIPLLNHPELLKDGIRRFGFNKAIDLSSKLDLSLIQEAIISSDPDIILAGLISLNLPE